MALLNSLPAKQVSHSLKLNFREVKESEVKTQICGKWLKPLFSRQQSEEIVGLNYKYG